MNQQNQQPSISPRPSLPEGLNGAQMAAVQNYIAVMVQQAVVDMKLRQWCVEKAIETDARHCEFSFEASELSARLWRLGSGSQR